MGGQILVYGPPGTGKTTWGINQVEEEMQFRHPCKIAYVSFTNAAADEAIGRAMKKFRKRYTYDDFPWFRTIHSACYRLLHLTPQQILTPERLKKDFCSKFGYKLSVDEDAVSELDEGIEIQEMMLKTDADVFNFFDSWRKHKMLFDFDRAFFEFRRQMLELPHTWSRTTVWDYIKRKNHFKQENKLWDFEDLLIGVWQRKLCPDIEVLIVDECQDNSPLMHEVIMTWAERAERSYFIGDVNQCIYSWMGSDPSLMLNLKYDDKVYLRQSYRVPKAAHRVAREIITRNVNRFPDDDFLPTSKEGEVKRTPMEQTDFDGGKTFVLARTRWLMGRYYNFLLRKGIPFEANRGKRSPLQREEGRCAWILLRLRDGEPVTLEELDYLAGRISQKPFLKRGARAEIKKRAKSNPSLPIGRTGIEDLGYTKEFFAEIGRDFAEVLRVRDEDKSYLNLVLRKYGRKPFEVLEKHEQAQPVLLSTIHGVKGEEADQVFLDTSLTTRVETGLRHDPEPENRVWYTGVTRTRDKLFLMPPQGYYSFRLPTSWK